MGWDESGEIVQGGAGIEMAHEAGIEMAHEAGIEMAHEAGIEMAHEPALDNLRKTVVAGEALRRDLARDLTRAAGYEQGAIEMELAMFYGRAFVLVARALVQPLEPESRAIQAFEEAIRGRAVFIGWLDEERSVRNGSLNRMGILWGRIVDLVLGGQGTADE